jgi:hypothetical protein
MGVKWRPDENRHRDVVLPSIGACIEVRRTGMVRRGTVEYVDRLQVIVRWDNGTSSSLPVGRDPFRVVEPGHGAGASAA